MGYAQLVLNLILIRLEQQTWTWLQSLLRLAPHPSLGYDDQATMPKIWHYINVQYTDVFLWLSTCNCTCSWHLISANFSSKYEEKFHQLVSFFSGHNFRSDAELSHCQHHSLQQDPWQSPRLQGHGARGWVRVWGPQQQELFGMTKTKKNDTAAEIVLNCFPPWPGNQPARVVAVWLKFLFINLIF